MLNQKIDEANKSEFSGGNSGWFSPKEGSNQFRILSEPEVIFMNYGKGICYHQCGFEGNPKYLTRILDRADNKVKLYKLPFKVFETIAGFEQDDELTFSGFPMPYDVKLNAKGAGSKEVKYTVMPSLKRIAIDIETENFLVKQNPIKEVIEAMQKKNIEKHKADGTWQKEQDRLTQLAHDLQQGNNIGVKDPEASLYEYPDEDIDPNDIPF